MRPIRAPARSQFQTMHAIETLDGQRFQGRMPEEAHGLDLRGQLHVVPVPDAGKRITKVMECVGDAAHP